MHARQLGIGIGVAVFALLAISIPTALIANPLFSRMTPITWWDWPVAIASAVLVGILVAIPRPSSCRPATRSGIVGSGLTFLAVGCPTCNQLVVLAIGATGALTWFAPIQPVLGIAGLGVLTLAIAHRLRLLRRSVDLRVAN